MSKFLRHIKESARRLREFSERLDGEITRSKIGKGNLARMLHIPYKTFYRKLKMKKFNSGELVKIITEVEKALELKDQMQNSPKSK